MSSKVSFSTLKLKVDDGVNTFNFAEKEIEVRKYLPIEEKRDLVDVAIQKSVKMESGRIDEVELEKNFNLNIVYLYTNLNFTEKQREDEGKIYDQLRCSGLLDEVVAHMDQDEYREVLDYLTLTKESYTKYSESLMAGVATVLEQLPQRMREAVEIMNSGLKPESFENVKAMVDLAKQSGMNNATK